MGDFSELIRHFDKIRGYVRDFYVYGFKTRDDYRDGSGRTYDNERRRIENWFGPYISSEYQRDKRKAVAITIDSSRISVNPLFAAWKSKSFTSNDIMLHFFLTDLLSDGKYRSADQCTDEIQEKYEVLFDSQTVRKKLAEYEAAEFSGRKRRGADSSMAWYGRRVPFSREMRGIRLRALEMKSRITRLRPVKIPVSSIW